MRWYYCIAFVIIAFIAGIISGIWLEKLVYSPSAKLNNQKRQRSCSLVKQLLRYPPGRSDTQIIQQALRNKQPALRKTPVTSVTTSSDPQDLDTTQKTATHKPTSMPVNQVASKPGGSYTDSVILPLETNISSNWEAFIGKDNTEQPDSLLGMQLYKPTYVMPAYYTANPYQSVYKGNTPDNQSVMRAEFKAQLSLLVPLATHLLNTTTSVNFAYTQLSYWQVYARSQYFRETDYEPELFIHHDFNQHWSSLLGVVHQSNGRGGDFERSWNRVYAQFDFSDGHWEFRMKPWVLVFKNESSELHNPDIQKYLGNGSLQVIYRHGRHQIALTSRNNTQSGFQRGMTKIQWNYRLWHYFYIYAQALSGYGQSLLEYDHHTNSAGIGIALNGL